MTKEQTVTSVPEELYNLTQLADVTLAAGRLSTTNINEIKDYIKNKSNTKTKLQTMNNSTEKITNQTDVNNDEANIMETLANEKSSEISNENAVKTNKEFQNCKPVELYNNKQITMTSCSNTTFYSDDDSSYYSHKIFDRKKLRRSTISDNSTHDEHSCSSIPSCSSSNSNGSSSGDEQQNICFRDECSPNNSMDEEKMDIQNSGLLEDEHICPECGKKYSTSSNLARHRQTHR